MKYISTGVPSRPIQIPSGSVTLDGNLNLPSKPIGVVLFAYSSGSNHLSLRNRYFAQILNEAGFATLLMDLLTPLEDVMNQQLKFDLSVLAKRLIDATHWLAQNPHTQTLSLAYFGASTGTAVALMAAAQHPEAVSALVSQSGHLNLVDQQVLNRVQTPTLLIVGGDDETAISSNRHALNDLSDPKQLILVPSVTHLLSQSNTLEQVAGLARDWFKQYLS